jgi:hypothetical protein
MSLSKTSRQLRREVTAHPKKAAILGLLFLVALWFWVPLVWSWIDEDDPANEPPAAKEAADSSLKPSAARTTKSDTSGKRHEKADYPWQQVVQWMNNDPRTSAVNPTLGRRDPFLSSPAEEAQSQLQEEPEEALAEATPEELGMVFSGTMIGPHRRVAQINGESYRPGETVRVVNGGGQIEFTLATVAARRIVLKRKGRLFELTIPSPARFGRIELSERRD